jgi:hypothetical protein
MMGKKMNDKTVEIESDIGLGLTEEDLNPPNRYDLLSADGYTSEDVKEIWEHFSLSRKNDPFLLMSRRAMIAEGATPETIAINKSLLSLYVNGMIEVCMKDEFAQPLIRLSEDGGHIIYAEMTATFMPIAEA